MFGLETLCVSSEALRDPCVGGHPLAEGVVRVYFHTSRYFLVANGCRSTLTVVVGGDDPLSPHRLLRFFVWTLALVQKSGSHMPFMYVWMMAERLEGNIKILSHCSVRIFGEAAEIEASSGRGWMSRALGRGAN